MYVKINVQWAILPLQSTYLKIFDRLGGSLTRGSVCTFLFYSLSCFYHVAIRWLFLCHRLSKRWCPIGSWSCPTSEPTHSSAPVTVRSLPRVKLHFVRRMQIGHRSPEHKSVCSVSSVARMICVFCYAIVHMLARHGKTTSRKPREGHVRQTTRNVYAVTDFLALFFENTYRRGEFDGL